MYNPGNWTVGPDGTTVVSDYPHAGTVIASGLTPADAVAMALAPAMLQVLDHIGYNHSQFEEAKRLRDRAIGHGRTAKVGG